MNIEKQFGMRIRYLRKKRHMSIEDFALECGINYSYLCDLENGRRNPTIKIIEKIAKGLGLTLSELFQGITSFDQKALIY